MTRRLYLDAWDGILSHCPMGHPAGTWILAWLASEIEF